MIIYQCDYCGKQVISESGWIPKGWFNMGYASNRYEYACSQVCMTAINKNRRLGTPIVRYELIMWLSNGQTFTFKQVEKNIPLDRESVRYFRDLINDSGVSRAQIRKVSL